MRLKFTEAVAYLGVSEGTARNWVKNRGLPVHRADERWFVNPLELWEWASEQNLPVSPQLLAHASRAPEPIPALSALLRAGGIQRDVPGRTPPEVLRAVVESLPLPPHVDREFLVTALAAREAMGSTGIGYGIAIPHVRNPILLHVEEPLVSLGLLAHAVDYDALDGAPVRVLFTVISPTVPAHLRMLAQLSLLLRDEPLRRLLAQAAPDDAILERIATLERAAAPEAGAADPRR